MKNILTLLCCFICFTLFSQNQNLVLNGNFEISKSCPNNGGQINLLKKWFQGNLGSSDYFDSCATIWDVRIPRNARGYQLANRGKAYVGSAYLFQTKTSKDIREYISTKLKSTLKRNKIYSISMFISLANVSKYSISKANIGIYFSKDSIDVPQSHGYQPLPFQPQIIAGDTSEFIEDTISWMKINMLYQSRGKEKYLAIGNFNDDINTKYRVFNSKSNYPGAYYYIDDVSLHKVETPYEIAMDSIALYHPCYDSAAVKITNSGDSTLDFSQHPLTVNLALKQGSDTVQTLQKIINNNQGNNGLPLKKDSSIWLSFALLNYNGNSANYTVRVEATMAADSFPSQQ